MPEHCVVSWQDAAYCSPEAVIPFSDGQSGSTGVSQADIGLSRPDDRTVANLADTKHADDKAVDALADAKNANDRAVAGLATGATAADDRTVAGLADSKHADDKAVAALATATTKLLTPLQMPRTPTTEQLTRMLTTKVSPAWQIPSPPTIKGLTRWLPPRQSCCRPGRYQAYNIILS
jgi:hypothetical protein